MKHIKLFTESIEDEHLPDNIKLVTLLWNGIYRNFNNEPVFLTTGDHTDKGTIIKKYIDRTDVKFSTEQGIFKPYQLKVYTSDNYWDLQDFIKMKANITKYNL